MKQIIGIGALGGSGTRAVAKIISELGFFIGDSVNLNSALDNLIYTIMFTEKKIFNSNDIIKERMIIFDKYMSNEKLKISDFYKFIKSKGGNYFSFYFRFIINLNFLRKTLFNYKKRKNYAFKEPNSIHYLELFLETFPESKYIFVLRNGLDMAFSSNKAQLSNFGKFYGLENNVQPNGDFSFNASKLQLDYWIIILEKVNKLKLKYPNRIHTINHSNLCKNSNNEIINLITFLGLTISKAKLKELSNIPKVTKTFNRYLKEDFKKFDESKIQYVFKQMDKTSS